VNETVPAVAFERLSLRTSDHRAAEDRVGNAIELLAASAHKSGLRVERESRGIARCLGEEVVAVVRRKTRAVDRVASNVARLAATVVNEAVLL